MTRRGLRDLALAVFVFVAAFLLVPWWDFAIPPVGGARYQAIFLINGQAYFGRVEERLGPYVKVHSVYYIVQARTDVPDGPPDSRLVRRGTEPHRPLPGMLIPRSAVQFVEDLRPTSPIGTYIDQDLTRR